MIWMISENMWQNSLGRVLNSSLCICHGGLIQFKGLHSPPALLDEWIVRCCLFSPLATLAVRGVALCPSLQDTCSDHVLPSMTIRDRCLMYFLKDVVRLYLGETLLDYKVPDIHANVLVFASLLAHRLILFNWKSNSAPSLLQWLRDLLFPANTSPWPGIHL